MADVDKIKANSDTYQIKDTTARDSITDLNNSKQDTIEVNEPLDLTDNTLSIDLSNYYTKAEVKEFVNKLTNTMTSNYDTLLTFISRDHSSLKKFVPSLVTEEVENSSNSGVISDSDIPDVSDYSDTKNSLAELKSQEATDISTLTETVSSLNDSLTSTIETYKDLSSTRYTDTSSRINDIEKEMFGSVYEAGKDDLYDSNSRIDDLETKVNKIYNALLNLNVISE